MIEKYEVTNNAQETKPGLIRIANSTDEKNSHCKDAALTPANIHAMANYRIANTAYAVGDIVACPYHAELQLVCITAGTTAATKLDTTNVKAEQTLTDGGVKWQVDEIGKVKSVNGQTGDVNLVTIAPGFIQPYGGTTVPAGWLPCDGAAVSRTTYAALFAAIGTTYGAGNGSTTFNLPNLGSNLVSDVATGDLDVVGTGIAMGFTEGANLVGTSVGTPANSGARFLRIATGSYGRNVGENSGTGNPNNDKVVGLTTDATKSGIVAKMTATKTTVKYCIKY